jgi:hypothetical protein
MATVSAALTLTSENLTSSSLSLVSRSNLVKAGTKRTGIDNTTGIARKTTTSASKYTLFRADDYTDDKAHKVYLKNTSVVASEYFSVAIDDEPMGRLYAGDFAFFPWSASDGIKATFTITLTNTWATGDTLIFDGVTATNGATETGTGFIDIISTLKYPNWTVAETSATVATFTAKSSNYLGLIEEGVASDDWVKSSSAGVNTVARGVVASASSSDIKITPSVATTITLEHALLYEL